MYKFKWLKTTVFLTCGRKRHLQLVRRRLRSSPSRSTRERQRARAVEYAESDRCAIAAPEPAAESLVEGDVGSLEL